MLQIIKRCVLMIIVSLVPVLTACAKSDEKPDPAPTTVAPASVKLQIFYPQIQYAGLYAAESQGYFPEEQLMVVVEPLTDIDGSVFDQMIADVAAGEAQFGIAPLDNLLTAHQQGVEVVGLMTFFQVDPNAVVALKAEGITRPEDLVGKEILFFTPQTIWDLFLHINHLDPNDITIVTPPDGGVNESATAFLTGQVDAMVGPAPDIVHALTAFGLEHDALLFYDYGLRSYPNVVFTTRQFIEEHPDVVQHFVNALLRGLHYAVEQPKATAEWFVEHYGEFLRPEQLALQDETMAAIVPLINIGTSEIGMMEAEVWQQVYEGMVELGLLDISTTLGDAYTLEFLNAYYRANP